MAVHLGIDFGARVIKIYQKGRGIVLREPNVAAVDTNGIVVAVGNDALMLRGRAPGTVTIRRPIENGSIGDFNLCAELLDRFLEKAAPRTNKHILAAVKYGFGSHNRELFRSALADCRTGRIEFVDSSVAAIKGCGIYSDHNSEYGGTLVCDVGASIVETAYVRSGELLRAESSRRGGDFYDLEICTYGYRKYGVAITPAAARDEKHKINLLGDNNEITTLSGTDTTTGMPKQAEFKTEELVPLGRLYADGVVSLIQTAVSNLPVHGTNESHVEQVVLTGGGAEMAGFGEYVAGAIGMELIMPPSAADCVILGVGQLLEDGR